MAQARVRVRYRRVVAAGGSFLVTLVAVMGGIGLLPSAAEPSAAEPRAAGQQASLADAPTVRAASADRPARAAASSSRAAVPPAAPRPESREVPPREPVRFVAADDSRSKLALAALKLPVESGTGRRVVFDQSAQRVWLVDAGNRVRRSYPVSGSVEDNLRPGTYEVYSRSMRALGIDDAGTMRYMVRFAHGKRAAIGFHDIPVKDGRYVQTRDQLGVARSHGCIRQWRPDAQALWAFAPLGTKVVVVP